MKKTLLTASLIVTLGACSEEAKQELGLVNVAPDEFSVITRAPLSVPPDFAIRPPRPGAQRPMEISTKDQARQTVFGVSDTVAETSTTPTSDDFLGKVGVNNADPNIREVLATEEPVDNRTTAERLLFLKGKDDNAGDPIDPNAEFERLKEEGVVTIKKRTEETPAP